MTSPTAPRARCSTAFPAPSPQAEALDKMLAERGSKIDLVLELKVDDAVLLARVESRIKAGGRPAVRRHPGDPKNRLEVYYKNTAPLLDYYRAQGKLRTVDGMAAIDEVTRPDRRGPGRVAGLRGLVGPARGLWRRCRAGRDRACDNKSQPGVDGRGSHSYNPRPRDSFSCHFRVFGAF